MPCVTDGATINPLIFIDMKYNLKKVDGAEVMDFARPMSWYEFSADMADKMTEVYVELLLQFNPDIQLSMNDYLSGRIVCGNCCNMPSLHLLHNSGEPRYSITDTRNRDCNECDDECLFMDALGNVFIGVFTDTDEDEYYQVCGI